MDILELLHYVTTNEIGDLLSTSIIKKANEEINSEVNLLSYLEKGERIRSIKKDEEELEDEFQIISFFNVKISEWEKGSWITYEKLKEKLAKKLVRPHLNNVDDIVSNLPLDMTPSLVACDDLYNKSNQCIDFNQIFKAAGPAYEVQLPKFQSNGKAKPITVVNGQLPAKYHRGYVKTRNGRKNIIDYSIILAELLLITACNEELKKLSLLKEKEESIVYNALVNFSKEILAKELVIVDEIFGDKTSSIISIIRENGGIIHSRYPYEKDYLKLKYDANLRLLSISDSIILLATYNFQLPCFDYYVSSHYLSAYVDVYKVIWSQYQSEKRNREYNKRLSSDYASSFETKKNVPTKILKAMATSKLNDYFGYVEFDQDCDLEKISLIEKEFDILANIFNQSKLEDYNIRFRRLGKHKAGGLYFPSFNCMCVDLDSPGSLAHEYWHLIDFKYEGLSNKQSFKAIYDKYVCLLDDLGESNKTIKEKMNSKSKFNRSYYTTPTEVFARCGELYLVYVLKLQTSLCATSGMGYFSVQDLLTLIDQYYTKLLINIKET